MDKKALRPLVIEILRANPQTHLNAVISEVKRRFPDYKRYDALLIQEIIWELLVQGVLAPGKNSLNLNLPFIHLTEYGERALAEETVIQDPTGYMRAVEKKIGRPLPWTIRVYLEESLLSFLAGRNFASAVLLGIAAKECLQEFSKSVPAPLPLDITGLSHRFITLGLPEESADSLAVAVTDLRRIARYIEDQPGHPSTRPVSRETAHAHLLLFFDRCAQLLIGLRRFTRGQ